MYGDSGTGVDEMRDERGTEEGWRYGEELGRTGGGREGGGGVLKEYRRVEKFAGHFH